MSKIFILIAAAFLLTGCEKQINGKVIDCTTKTPLSDAIVSTNQTGWGIRNGQIVWDKTYKTVSQTNTSGLFELRYYVGDSAKIHAAKNGYYSAEQFEYPGNNVVIELLPGDNPIEFTHHCRLVSDCIECIEVDEVLKCQDTCAGQD